MSSNRLAIIATLLILVSVMIAAGVVLHVQNTESYLSASTAITERQNAILATEYAKANPTP